MIHRKCNYFTLTYLILIVMLLCSACSKNTPSEAAALSYSSNISENDSNEKDSNEKDSSEKDSSAEVIQVKEKKTEDIKSTNLKDGNSKKEDQTIKKIIAIDAGHQSKANNEKEPIGPGATTKKAKVSSGTQGTYTKVPEYKLNLVITKKVKAELIARGYEVYMIRETNNVNLSNKERAELANESGADLLIRIHADGSDNPSIHGASTLYPSKKNPYVSSLSEASLTLSEKIIDGICEQTGAKNRGAIARDDMSGINWCTIPVSIIEMGYMSNKKEDKLMQTADYQDKIVQGICDGIDQYYKVK